jgi:spermidine synthase
LLIDTAEIPGGGGELRLIKRGEEYSIMLGSNELMNSRLSGSEEALAEIASERISERRQASMLIGGLGMGFTLRAALARLNKDAEVTVVELVPAVVSWARGPLAHIFGSSLDDPRTTILEADAAVFISGRGVYDAILLDVDNGPDGLTRSENNRLYTLTGLRIAREALKAGGVLAVWSAGPDGRFTDRLRRAGYQVEERVVRANRGRGGRHVIWLATNPG